MTRCGYRRGSILMLALWIIAVLSVIVLSFAFEARQQAGLDVYIRERNRVRRVVDSGKMLAEAVLLGFKDAKDPEINGGAPDWSEAFREDRWAIEKHELKKYKKCTIGPLTLDESTDDEGDVVALTIEIKQENAGSKIDINSLLPDSDQQYVVRWQRILQRSGIPDDLMVEVDDANRSGKKQHNLMNLLIASFKDWTDEDKAVSSGPITDEECDPQEDDGAEEQWYLDRQEEDEIPEKNRRVPPNGKIKKLEELSYIRGFRDFPAVLTGGLLYPNEKESEENPRLTGIMKDFKISGGSKIAITDQTTAADLSTIPGFFPEDFEDSSEADDCEELVQSVITALHTMPEDDDNIDETRTWWPFKDLSDMKKRVSDIGCDVNIRDTVGEYLDFSETGSTSSTSAAKKPTDSKGGKSSGNKNSGDEEHVRFEVKITGQSMGMKYSVVAICYIDSDKVCYVEWREDPSTVE